MTLHPDMALATGLYARLTHRENGLLEGFKTKRLEDNLWFDLDSQGHLTISSRPLSFLERFWEAIVRFFTSKYSNLQREFVWISDRVEEYLAEESDERRLGLFLNEYTPAINELYRIVGRLVQAQRISRDGWESMRTKRKIHDLILTEPLAGSPDRRYQFHGCFFIGNDMKNASVVFHVLDPDGGMSQLANHEIGKAVWCYLDVKSRGNPNTMMADVKQEHRIPNRNTLVKLCGTGQIAASEDLLDEKGVKFINEGDRPLRIRMQGLSADEGQFVLMPQETRLCGFPEGDEIFFATTYSTDSVHFKIASKMAKYFACVDAQGKLALDITPLHVVDTGPWTNYYIDQASNFQPKNSQFPLGLATIQGNSTTKERIFIPQEYPSSPPVLIGRAKLAEWFGVRWDGHLAASTARVESPIPRAQPLNALHFTGSPLRVRA